METLGSLRAHGTNSAGHTGVGEAPGGDTIYQTLVEAIPQVKGQQIARMNRLVQQVHKGNQSADFTTFGNGAWTFELRVNAVAALEAALQSAWGGSLLDRLPERGVAQ